MRKKLRSRSGFSLVELLAATLVLSLLSLAISGGVSVAVQVYTKSVFVSESEVLQDTLNISLSDVLRYARYSGTDEAGTVSFTNSVYGIASGHFVTVDGRLYINPGSGDDGDTGTLMLFVNSGAYTSMVVEDFAMTYDPATATFSGSYLLRVSNVPSLSKACQFTFTSVAYQQVGG